MLPPSLLNHLLLSLKLQPLLFQGHLPLKLLLVLVLQVLHRLDASTSLHCLECCLTFVFKFSSQLVSAEGGERVLLTFSLEIQVQLIFFLQTLLGVRVHKVGFKNRILAQFLIVLKLSAGFLA